MTAVYPSSRSHFSQQAAQSESEGSDDDDRGEGTSSGPGFRGLQHQLVGVAARTNTVASLLEESVKFVKEKNPLGTQQIPWAPINKKSSTTDSPSSALPKVNSPAPTSPNTPPTSAAATPTPSAAGFPAIPPAVSWPRQLPPGAGLHNLGNTCFLNSAVQCFLHTAPLVRYTLDHQHDPKTCVMMAKKGFCMQCATAALVRQSFMASAKASYAPKAVVSNIKKIAKHMRLGRQEDSHEFLRFMVDALQESALFGKGGSKLDQKIKETTFVHQIFGGRLRSRVLCTECNHPSDTFDSLLDLSLDIHRLDSLKDALQNFAKKDILKGQNKYKCDKCRKLVVAEKSFAIDKAPMVLTIHLKRFTPTGRKISDAIKYPEVLQLGPYMSERKANPTYKLYGVVNHLGGGLSSGHYTADVRAANGQWYRCDDSDVSRTNGPPLNAKSAYVLFYCREQGDALKDIIGGTAVAGETKGQAKKRARESLGAHADAGGSGRPDASPHSAKKPHLLTPRPKAEAPSPKPPQVISAASAKASPSAPAVATPNPFAPSASPVAAVQPGAFYGGGKGAKPVQLIPTDGKLTKRKDRMLKKQQRQQNRPAMIRG